METFNFIFVIQHTTQNFTIQKIQQKLLYALVRFMKLKNLRVHYVEKGIPFLALSGFFEPGGLPLARSSHPGRA